MEQHLRVSRVRQRLIKAAKNGRLVYYGEFLANSGYYGVVRGQGQPHQIGNVLGEICENERASGRPLLSAICVLKSTGMPSYGFWGFLGTDAPDRMRWEKERDRVFDWWQTHNQ